MCPLGRRQRRRRLRSAGRPLAVRQRGLSIVYQEFTLVPDLTVAENVFLGREEGALLLRSVSMRAGEVLVYDTKTLHGSTPNRSAARGTNEATVVDHRQMATMVSETVSASAMCAPASRAWPNA
mgnify:CR=1 FL=1